MYVYERWGRLNAYVKYTSIKKKKLLAEPDRSFSQSVSWLVAESSDASVVSLSKCDNIVAATSL